MSKPIDFDYRSPGDAAGLPASVSIYADRGGLKKQIEEDLIESGFRILHTGDVAALLDGGLALLGDVVVLDMPVADAERLAALNRIDMRVANSGAQLIVSTSIDALDEVFACLDQSAPQILVDPSRADRVVAVGRVLGAVASSKVRELSAEDRLALLHLSDQVDQIAKRLDGLSGSVEGLSADKPVFNYSTDLADAQEPLVTSAKPSLPDPRLVREIIRRRQARARFFDSDLFGDPAWDMLLDLTAAHAELRRVSVTSLCIASGVPTTTALRWVRQMTEAGLFVRVKDSADKRRAFISLSDGARDAMAGYFAAIGEPAMAYAA